MTVAVVLSVVAIWATITIVGGFLASGAAFAINVAAFATTFAGVFSAITTTLAGIGVAGTTTLAAFVPTSITLVNF